jgi:hypothetical protein
MVSGRIEAHELERLLPWAWKAERLTATIFLNLHQRSGRGRAGMLADLLT